MNTARRTRPWCALAPLPAVAALACAALTGCGTTTVTSDASTATSGVSTVCAHARHVDRLTIDRVNLLPQNHVHFTFPAQVSVTGTRQAQAVAQALCALPPMPHGAFNCPADWGISYRFSFTSGASRLRAVNMEATGCQMVHGLSPARWVLTTPTFWKVLGTAAGLPHPGSAAFRGTTAS